MCASLTYRLRVRFFFSLSFSHHSHVFCGPSVSFFCGRTTRRLCCECSALCIRLARSKNVYLCHSLLFLSVGPPAYKDPFREFSGSDDLSLIPDYALPGPNRAPSSTETTMPTSPQVLTSKDSQALTQTPMVVDLTYQNCTEDQPGSELGIETVPESTVKSPFKHPTHSQDPPELVRLRRFIQVFPDTMAIYPSTWAF